MKLERKKNAVRNIRTNLINRIVSLLVPFVMRTIIIKELGSGYLGLSSLFTSILQILNLSELGISTAIVSSMYKPIAEENARMICDLMAIYKKAYHLIGWAILVIGLAVTPLLPRLISGTIPHDVNLYALYFIYLFNTVISYFLFAYQGSLLVAHQRSDLSSNIDMITKIITYFAQIGILIAAESYYLYIVMLPICTIANNLVCAKIASKLYPQYRCSREIHLKDLSPIKKNIGGLVIFNVCSISRNSLDSIFISAFLGLTAVTVYGNYFYVISTLGGVLGILVTSVTAGAGNSVVVESEAKNYNDMCRLNFLYMWVAGWCAICLACLFQPFMKVWMGTEMMLPFHIAVLFSIYFYSLRMNDILYIYIMATGIWWKHKARTIAETMLNIILNYVLGKKFGIPGIIAATNISIILCAFFWGAEITFKTYFGSGKLLRYYLEHALYALITFLNGFLTYFVCDMVRADGYHALLARAAICLLLPNLVFAVAYRRTPIFGQSASFILDAIRAR